MVISKPKTIGKRKVDIASYGDIVLLLLLCIGSVRAIVVSGPKQEEYTTPVIILEVKSATTWSMEEETEPVAIDPVEEYVPVQPVATPKPKQEVVIEEPVEKVAYTPGSFEEFLRHTNRIYARPSDLVEHKRITDTSKVQAMNLAYYIGGMDFLATLDQEDDTRDPLRRSSTGDGSVGLCQLLPKYHSTFIDSDYFLNLSFQVMYCYDVRVDAIQKGKLSTTFYGFNARYDNIERFTILWE